MLYNQKKMFFSGIIVILFSINGYGADTIQTLSITPAGWEITQPYPKKRALVQVIEGNYGVVRYWEANYGGGNGVEYTVLRTADSLKSFWKKQSERRGGLAFEMPNVNFKNNILIVVQPGPGNTHFKYKVNSSTKGDTVDLLITQYLFGKLRGAVFGMYPLMAFEIPAPGYVQKLKVHFNLDYRSNWSGFKK